MQRILGIGGESIVLQKTINLHTKTSQCALKIAPTETNSIYDNFFKAEIKQIMPLGKDSETSIYKDVRPKELTANSLVHQNIVKYIDHTFEVIDNDIFHITGI